MVRKKIRYEGVAGLGRFSGVVVNGNLIEFLKTFVNEKEIMIL